MKVGNRYHFNNLNTLEVEVTRIGWKDLRRWVWFYTLYNGERVGYECQVTYSYAKKNWLPA